MLAPLAVFDETFRGYRSTAELITAWTLTDTAGIASFALGTSDPGLGTLHPRQYLELTIDNTSGSNQAVTLERPVDWTGGLLVNVHGSVFASADAGLAGTIVRPISSGVGDIEFVFDGTWREYFEWDVFGSQSELLIVGLFDGVMLTGFSFNAIPPGASGVIRLGWIRGVRDGADGFPLPPATPVIPFAPDWSSPPELTISFRTSIMESWSGDEQREQQLIQPRGRLRYTITLTDDREVALCNALLTGEPGKVFGVPLWSERVFLDHFLPPFGGEIEMTAIGSDDRLFGPGKGVLLWQSPFHWEAFAHDRNTAPSDAFVITPEPVLSYKDASQPPPAALVVPLRPGIIANPFPLRRPATRGMRIPLEFELLQI